MKFLALFEVLDKLNFLKFSESEKFRLLNKIKAISNSGQEEKKAIINKITEFEKRKKYNLVYILNKVKNEIDNGKKIVDALYECKIINAGEYYILKNTKGSIAIGIDKIIEIHSKSSKSLMAFILMLLPPAIMLVALLASHGEVKEVLDNMMKPIISAGATPPEMPHYLVDNTNYIIFNVAFFGFLILSAISLYVIKNYFPKKYLTIFPIIQQEYMLDLLKAIQNVSKGGGMNISNTAKALAMGQSNNVKKLILEEIVDETQNGRIYISHILDAYGVNYSVCSNISIGEDAGNINNGLLIAISELESEYNRNIKLFLKSGMWIGQISMILIAMKPMIDIMILVSVGPLNFKL